MAKHIDPKDLAATWVIEHERAGVPALIGTSVRIEIQQLNPMLRRAVITPVSGAQDSKYAGTFEKVKPQVTMIENDMLLCSMGIMARRSI